MFDELDKRLLRELQTDATLSADELAKRCATSPSTALRRIRALRESGHIIREVAQLDHELMGWPLLLFVTIRLSGENEEEADAFIEQVRSYPGVMQFFFVTGSSDYIVLFNARTMNAYDVFVKDCLVNNPIVRLSDTNVVIRPLKMDLSLPI